MLIGWPEFCVISIGSTGKGRKAGAVEPLGPAFRSRPHCLLMGAVYELMQAS